MLLTKENAQSIVSEMKAVIHRNINIMDETGVIVASTNPTRCGQTHAGALRIIQEGLNVLTISEDDPEHGVQRGVNLPIIIDGRLIGVIGITGDPDEVSLFGDIISRMTVIMIEGMRQREQADLMHQAKSYFVESWLFSQDPDPTELEIRGKLLGIDVNSPFTVALLQVYRDSPAGQADALPEMQNGLFLQLIHSRIGGNPQNFCAVIRNRIMILLCRTTRKEALATVSQICVDIESFYAVRMSGGISSASEGPLDLRRCFLEAQAANAAAAQSGTRRVVFYDQVSLEFIARSIPKSIRQDLHNMVFSACTPEENREFLQTIQLYFAYDGEIKTCAEKLFVHRNTFQYRMDRLKQKTGYSLKKPKEALLLYLAAQKDK